MRRDLGRTINVPVTLTTGQVLMVSKIDVVERAASTGVLHARLRHSQVVLLPLVGVFCVLLLLVVRWAL